MSSRQSAFSFHIIQPDLACENGLAFTQRILHHQLYVCILDLGCTRAMGSRRAVEAFCSFLTHIQTVDPGMKFSQQVRDSSLQIPNNPSALRNL